MSEQVNVDDLVPGTKYELQLKGFSRAKPVIAVFLRHLNNDKTHGVFNEVTVIVNSPENQVNVTNNQHAQETIYNYSSFNIYPVEQAGGSRHRRKPRSSKKSKKSRSRRSRRRRV